MHINVENYDLVGAYQIQICWSLQCDNATKRKESRNNHARPYKIWQTFVKAGVRPVWKTIPKEVKKVENFLHHFSTFTYYGSLKIEKLLKMVLSA